MNTRLSRSIPYWTLIALSAVSVAYGTWLTTDKLATMSTTLLDGTATGVEVYGGQAWVTFGAAFVVAGLIGFVLALALAAARALLAPAAPATEIFESEVVEVVEAPAWEPEAETSVVESDASESADADTNESTTVAR